MTAQEIFDTVAAHLRGMTHPSFIEKVGCVYRAPDGNRCAVGILITDEEYSPRMEKLGVFGLRDEGLLPERFKPHLALLSRLQDLHDEPTNWNKSGFDAEAKLAKVAANFNLTYTPKEA